MQDQLAGISPLAGTHPLVLAIGVVHFLHDDGDGF